MEKYFFFFFFLGISMSFSQNNPNDCSNALVVCGSSNFGLDPSGVGLDEFSLPGNNVPSCYSFNNNTIWLRFEVATSGTFMFDLIPDNGVDDYDFAIFGPNVTCTTLGSAIRCSSTNPQAAGVSANTGLNLSETDVTEGPGPDGNGYLRYIDANAGDVYFLLVDRAIGSDGFGINFTGTASLPEGVIANPVDNIVECDADGIPDGLTLFDLDTQITTVAGSQTNVNVTFHSSLNDANIGINGLSSPYMSVSNPQTIYVRIENVNGCTDVTSFIIETGNPEIQTPNDVTPCSFDPTQEFLLDTIIPEVVADPTGLVFSYHDTMPDAIGNNNPIGPSITLTEIPRTIYVRVSDINDLSCYSITSFLGLINRVQLATTPLDSIVCDDSFDGMTTLDLSLKDPEILNGLPPANFQVRYYRSVTDRLNDVNRITGVFQNTSNPQTIYVSLFEIATGCFDFTEFDIIVNPKPDPSFEDEPYMYCLNSTEPLAVSIQAGFDYYLWSTGEEGPDLNTILITTSGTYSVTVTNEFGCTTMISTNVLPSDIATIEEVIIQEFSGPDNSVTINVSGPGDYEFALDSEFYQDENIFRGLLNGYHTICVRDKNGCGIVCEEILILDYPRFFTPNDDGYHDQWEIIGISEFPATKIYIFDRYGKLLREIIPGTSGWDGTYNGNPLPSSDYWFTLSMEDGREVRGHFTLKR